jgi:hypothetical protein
MAAGVTDRVWEVEEIFRLLDLEAEEFWPMTEAEFWTDLEYRVSRELRELTDNHLRFLWCDGFAAR